MRDGCRTVATVALVDNALARDWRPDVLVLDVILPDIDGFEVARRLAAEHANVPIPFLTARDAITDKVWGLETGGGDHVTNPFSLEELVVRLRNIVRRAGASEEEPARLVFADLQLDEETREVDRGGRRLELTDTEFRLLRYLMHNPGSARLLRGRLWCRQHRPA